MKKKEITKRLLEVFIMILVGVVAIIPSASSAIFYDQGTEVKNSTGDLLESGNISVFIYDASSGGNLIYNETFVSAIINGSWNVQINPDLDFGKLYYKDYEINEDNMNFNGNDRIEFQSPFGVINNESFINFSLIGSCGEGSSIRSIYSNGSVVCETDNSGDSDWINDNSSLNTTLNINVGGNVSTSNYGFFGWLGSLVNRITKLFVQDIDASGNINASNYTLNGTTIDDWSDVGSGGGVQYTHLSNFTDDINASSSYNSTYDAKADYEFGSNNFNGTGNITATYFFGDISEATGITNLKSTGLIQGGVLSINAGDNTLIDITAGSGQVVDSTTDPDNPVLTPVTWDAKTGYNLTTIAVTGDVVAIFLSLNSSGDVVERAVLPTPEERRDTIDLGIAARNDINQITFIGSGPLSVVHNPTSQLQDFFQAWGPFNVEGNQIQPNTGADLQIKKLVGSLFRNGANFQTNPKDPHIVDLAEQAPAGFNYKLSDGTDVTYAFYIDPDNYDDGTSTLATVTNNKWTVQLVSVFASGLVEVLYGQEEFAAESDVVTALSTIDFTIPTDSKGAVPLAYLVLQQGDTSLPENRFYRISKGGAAGGAGGVTYSAGTGIEISNSVINLNTTYTDDRYLNSGNDTGNFTLSGNLTLGQKLTFAFGEIIDNIVDGWVRITGNLNVTGNIEAVGNITTSGRVGVGTTTPDQLLEIESDNNTVLQIKSTGGDKTSSLTLMRSSNASSDWRITNRLSSMYFGKSGNDGVSWSDYFKIGGTQAVPYIQTYLSSADLTLGGGDDIVFQTNNGSWIETMRLLGNGELLIGYTVDQGAYNLQVNGDICEANTAISACSSDRRLKENIVDVENALEYLAGLRPRWFNFIGSDKTMTGLIAQEINETHPELLVETGHGYYSWDNVGIDMISVKAIQELSEENDLLREENNLIKQTLCNMGRTEWC